MAAEVGGGAPRRRPVSEAQMLLRTVLSDMAAAPGSMLDDARADGRGEQTPHMRGDDAGDSGSDAASELRALERSEPKLEVRVSASS